MTVRPATRRLLVGSTGAALLLGLVGFVPLLGSASAACTPTYTDPAGDTAYAGQGPGDDDTDITAVAFSVDAGNFTASMTLKALRDTGPDFASGEIFSSNFTVAGKAVATKVIRDLSGSPLAAEEVSGRVSVAGTAVDGVKAALDLKTSTVSVTVPSSALATALGGDPTGKPFSLMTAESRADYGFANSPAPQYPAPLYDSAAGTASSSYVYGASCSGGTPVGTATPVPSGSASPTPSASPTASPAPTTAPDGTYLQPRKGCATYADPAGDADPTGIGEFNEGSLDVTQANLKSSAGQLQVFVKLATADEELYPWWSGHVYDVSFTVGGKKVVLSAPGDGPATATVGGTANTDLKATVALDVKNSNIVFTVPLDGLNKATATTVKAGTALTDTAIATYADSDLGPQSADTAAGTTPAQKTYAYGDNSCFLPPPGKILVEADKAGQYGDTTVLFATLNDGDDTPVSGVRLTATISGGKAIAAVTDADGTAEFRLRLVVPAGTKTITVSWAGNGEVGKAVATKAFVVTLERTAIRLKSISRGLQATLVDDDRHVVVGRVVVFTVGSKKYYVKTNSLGVARLTGIKKGTAIKVSFAGVRSYYAAAPTVTGRAG